jgi:DNA-binding NarL/FixJ family response regulator
VPSVRVFVVEDYEPFRQFVCSMLGTRPDLQLVGEASDGLVAVHKAAELQPDLIVLDLGLPTLNGIEATRRIRQLCPESQILILSQESSAEIVQEALRLGAQGYVVKTQAGSELLSAVDTILRGRQFVSSGLSNHKLADAADARSTDLDRQVLPLLESEKGEITRRHEVQFYSDDASFVVGFSRYIEATLKAGNPVILFATDSHRESLLQRLQARGVDVATAIEQGSYIPLDVADTLSTFMVNDLPDPVRLLKVAGDLLAAAAKSAKVEVRRVVACGECAPTLWAQGKADAAIQLEHLWD